MKENGAERVCGDKIGVQKLDAEQAMKMDAFHSQYFQVIREQAVFYKSCNLIGSESGQYSSHLARSQQVVDCLLKNHPLGVGDYPLVGRTLWLVDCPLEGSPLGEGNTLWVVDCLLKDHPLRVGDYPLVGNTLGVVDCPLGGGFLVKVDCPLLRNTLGVVDCPFVRSTVGEDCSLEDHPLVLRECLLLRDHSEVVDSVLGRHSVKVPKNLNGERERVIHQDILRKKCERHTRVKKGEGERAQKLRAPELLSEVVYRRIARRYTALAVMR
ncbi:hypothetical protein pdam_00014036 [Pocillopora damicornis]|uniref:Uncharacterized protein n=1 Tax=Pocillopora damicornis TaxID=46731 RepID=A0A3M6TUM9_POCDA|nr:hypothetical protein pdam_00014036 [Pocillopora damicornis]